jgi:aspartyl-tRNA(Asn)/glutamyl-tRNA(Gln) amidotransferase subunit B
LTIYDSYETVVGLEVHAQLLTESKLFCGDSAAFGGEPNTHISPVTLAHPGSLPMMNSKAIDFAIRIGLACNCKITRYNYFARKNYFYPDLPKGYQISQHTTPICDGGEVRIRLNNETKTIRLNRIHLEEDAGKSLHEMDPENTNVDLNRAGVPLVEIVSEPDIRSGEEAYAYLTELRKLLRYLEICDGNMEEGSMRCDANISIRKKGVKELGTKVEVKNLNSIRNVKRAIEFEAKRMIDMVEKGETIIQQTRSFDPAGGGSTFALREKEEANDYRYFADPDLTPFIVTDEMLNNVKAALPELPEERVQRYIKQWQLSEYDSRVISDEKEMALYFEDTINQFETRDAARIKSAANWMIGPIRNWMNENEGEIKSLKVTPQRLAELIQFIEGGKLNFSIASSRVFPVMVDHPNKTVAAIAEELNILQDSDEGNVNAWVEEVLKSMPDKVSEYKKGKKGLIGLFVGEVKKISRGKADPKLTNDILIKKLQA